MRGNKTAVWRNGTGQEIVFDNRTFFLEDIDMTGTAGIHTVETLARADGQVSIAHQVAAKTIPCSFAWKDMHDDRYMQERLTSLFNPLMPGTLTVYTRDNVYAIDCYPQDFPVFKRVSGLPVWRWEVDFVADYPYWRKGTERVFHLTSNTGNSLFSPCPFAIAPVIELPIASSTIHLGITKDGIGGSLTIDPDESARTLVIDTNTLTIKDKTTGADCSYLVDANEYIEALRIVRGYNNVICSEQSGQAVAWQNTILRYYELSMGEV